MSTATRRQFRAYVFDIYGTLFDVSALTRVSAGVLPEPVEFVRIWRAKQLEYAFIRSILGSYTSFEQITADALDVAAASVKATIGEGERQQLLRAWLELPPFADVPEALERLREISDQLLILTNGNRRMVDPLLRQAGVQAHFTTIFTSEAVQVFKPDQRMYRQVPDQLGIPSQEMLFVTSNGFDLAGAKAAGFTVCRIDRSGQPLDRLGHEPDITVGDLSGLVDQLNWAAG